MSELFKALCQGKLKIITCTLVFTISSMVYALNAQ
ncbi:hypothetical protein [Grimontia hollisae]|nr:hypothetical protein [Grimontia hollisae]MDF2183731.1 hypothetical protein [Grimontia hollisae]